MHGLLMVNKPLGVTSFDVVRQVRSVLNVEKCGHIGTLDPLATGMLPICLGQATKLAGYLTMSNKCYEVSAAFGAFTSTGDREGKIIHKMSKSPSWSMDQFREVIESFIGEHYQTPPMYSAIKHKGQPLYKLARQGIEVERTPRLVNIFNIKIIRASLDGFCLLVECSKGTYVRTLIEDIARKLDSAAYVTALDRQWVAPFQGMPMISLEKLIYQSAAGSSLHQVFTLPINFLLSRWSRVFLAQPMMGKFVQGQAINIDLKLEQGTLVRVFCQKSCHIVGLGTWSGSALEPKRILFPDLDKLH